VRHGGALLPLFAHVGEGGGALAEVLLQHTSVGLIVQVRVLRRPPLHLRLHSRLHSKLVLGRVWHGCSAAGKCPLCAHASRASAEELPAVHDCCSNMAGGQPRAWLHMGARQVAAGGVAGSGADTRARR